MKQRSLALLGILIAVCVLWSCGTGSSDSGESPTKDTAQITRPNPSLVPLETPTPAPTDTPPPTTEIPPPSAESANEEVTEPAVDAPVGLELSGDIERGKSLVSTCMGCHSVTGVDGVGPTWQELYGREVTLATGDVVTADDQYIMQSIRDPGSQIVEGFAPAMPPFSNLSDQDIQDIIAYIKSL